MRIVKFVTLGMLFAAPQAWAAQQLLQAPYPGQLGGNAQVTQGAGGGYHQELVPQPVPQAYGPAAQGNPSQPNGGPQPRPYPWQTWCNGASDCASFH